MPVTVLHHGKDQAIRPVSYEYATPIAAAEALLSECSLHELRELEMIRLRQIKGLVAQRERNERHDLGGEAGAA